jgi:hypothetical protein
VALKRMTMGLLAAAMALVAAPALAGSPSEGRLAGSATEVCPVLVGTTVPDGPLKTAEGRETTLGELLAGEPGLLVFYRGHW